MRKKELYRESILDNKRRIVKSVGIILKEERRKKGYTRKELSDRINISENYIGYIEQGKYEISLLKFILISNELDLNPNYVIRRVIEKVNKNEIEEEEEKDISKEILMYLKQ